MTTSLIIMASSDNLYLFLASWGMSNLILTRLMIGKRQWKEARFSASLARNNFALGFVFLLAAFILLHQASGDMSISSIGQSEESGSITLTISMVFILIAAMTQSAVWPFHRWLLSSLNSPTPISAMMHAGLVNGGGFLLTRFAPLFLSRPGIMLAIFLVGSATALLGTVWKLMQSDVKRMLACSTVGQMGFMLAQCGLGLFPAAIAHLLWHGLFKAYLFLASGQAAHERREQVQETPSAVVLSAGGICGLVGGAVFCFILHGPRLPVDTTFCLVVMAFLASWQLAITWLKKRGVRKLHEAVGAAGFSSGLYGISVLMAETFLDPSNSFQPPALNSVHIGVMGLFVITWGAMLFRNEVKLSWMGSIYVRALNACQPHPDTITAHRNHYPSGAS